MAQRRMIDKDVIKRKKFIKLSSGARALYFEMASNADDDGIIDAYNIITTYRHSEQDTFDLIQIGYIIPLNDDDVFFVTDFLKMNDLKADRYHPSQYKDLMLSVLSDEEKELYLSTKNNSKTVQNRYMRDVTPYQEYTDTSRIQIGYNSETQVRQGQSSQDQESQDKEKKGQASQDKEAVNDFLNFHTLNEAFVSFMYNKEFGNYPTGIDKSQIDKLVNQHSAQKMLLALATVEQTWEGDTEDVKVPLAYLNSLLTSWKKQGYSSITSIVQYLEEDQHLDGNKIQQTLDRAYSDYDMAISPTPSLPF